MRQGQQNKQRMRGRTRKGPNPLARSYESNGPDVKIRGTALHIAEKYLQLARDAQLSGDRVAGESYLQHAEHYFRIVAAAQAQMPQAQPTIRSDNADGDEDDRDQETDRAAPPPSGQQPSFGPSDPQPYVNGNGQGRADGEESGNGSDESSQEAGEPREGREPGSYRGRRRRPYRERANGNQAEAGSNEAPPSEPSEPKADAVTSED